VDLQISGPQQVTENSYAQYQATAYYEDSSTADVTPSATWSVEPQDVASVSGNGRLNTDRIETDTSLTVYADYTVAGGNLQAQAAVQVTQPVAIEIKGPDKIPGSFQEQYYAIVTYEDGSTDGVTTSSLWSVEPQTCAAIDQNGLVSTTEVNQTQDITISAQYTSAAVTVETQVLVQVVPPRILRVPSEYPTIQAAIDDAFDGDIVLVAPGTYTGEGNRDIYFRDKTIAVRSESGPENTIIDCNSSPDDEHDGAFHIVEQPPVTIDGFTITNSSYRSAVGSHSTDVTINNCIFTNNSGGSKSLGAAIYCGAGSLKITNCTFTDNSAGGAGGAIFLRHCTSLIDNCIIAENSSGRFGGAIHCYDSNLTITNSSITENTPWYDHDDLRGGGGIRVSDSTVVIANSTISHNSATYDGGGICYYSRNNEDSLTITNCTISGNSAKSQYDYGYGGGIYFYLQDAWYDPLIITNSVITANSAERGGGIYCNAPAAITHTTIANNTANRAGGGIYAYRNAQIDITNSILWANSPQQIYSYGDSTPTVTYSDVQGGWEGEGNIDADPCFVQPAESACFEVQGDYHLLPTSPCIDAAEDVGVDTDIEGTPRPYDYPDVGNNGDFDMGAYEAFIIPPYDRAVDSVTSVLDRQAELLALIDEFLALQWQAYDALEELLATDDYTDASKAEIVSARQKIYSSMQHHEQSADAFEKGINKLEGSMTSLGAEPEPNQTPVKDLIE
jgi:predicted outer membrane repeat protein